MMQYASVIVETSSSGLDRAFQYGIPDRLSGRAVPGSRVRVPFGKGGKTVSGYVTEVSGRPEFDPGRTKDILEVEESGGPAQVQLLRLAEWMKDRYGCTMVQALKTVMPLREAVRPLTERRIVCLLTEEQLEKQIAFCEGKHQAARLRLLEALRADREIPGTAAVSRLGLTPAVLRAAAEAGWIEIQENRIYRTPYAPERDARGRVTLNAEQREAVGRFEADYRENPAQTWLLAGVTGSGKTEVYMEMIDRVLARGKQVIVLIPEIALTYQTVMRFYRRFGDRVAMVNSRMSPGERYDQLCRAKSGEASVMIGPRSALFTPFPDLGLIVIDEEHDRAYKSESVPRYHARDAAAVRAELCGAGLVLGSATPSVESYYRAVSGRYRLLRLNRRAAAGSVPARVEIVDLRAELAAGNRQIFSRRLQELMEDRLARGEQTMLFINRRGYSGFVSCRSCGKAVKCDHCDVAMTVHRNGKMVCHYCGSEKPIPRVCPSCGSRYIAGFGSGTEKAEQLVRERFPNARVLRMDTDTTSRKGSHEAILGAFFRREADILVGTQMIVKGHDFPMVTLVGILAADQSLFFQEYTAGESTFTLLTQAAGRAGRADRPGDVVIQTYNPEHYAITAAAGQDYPGFFREEIGYRKLLDYPPFGRILTVQCMSADEELLGRRIGELKALLADMIQTDRLPVRILGPSDGGIARIKDIYRKMLYLRSADERVLELLRRRLEAAFRPEKTVQIQYDWNED